MDLPTYTSIWRIEKRLYKLYDLRLPMPLPLVQIGVYVGTFIPWALLLHMLGVPFETLVLYLVPPGVLTFLATRPAIENKRLTELLLSQGRYLTEPRGWCRMTPIQEPREIVVVGRVWRRRAPVPVPAAVARRAPARLTARRPAVAANPATVPAAPRRRFALGRAGSRARPVAGAGPAIATAPASVAPAAPPGVPDTRPASAPVAGAGGRAAQPGRQLPGRPRRAGTGPGGKPPRGRFQTSVPTAVPQGEAPGEAARGRPAAAGKPAGAAAAGQTPTAATPAAPVAPQHHRDAARRGGPAKAGGRPPAVTGADPAATTATGRPDRPGTADPVPTRGARARRKAPPDQQVWPPPDRPRPPADRPAAAHPAAPARESAPTPEPSPMRAAQDQAVPKGRVEPERRVPRPEEPVPFREPAPVAETAPEQAVPEQAVPEQAAIALPASEEELVPFREPASAAERASAPDVVPETAVPKERAAPTPKPVPPPRSPEPGMPPRLAAPTTAPGHHTRDVPTRPHPPLTPAIPAVPTVPAATAGTVEAPGAVPPLPTGRRPRGCAARAWRTLSRAMRAGASGTDGIYEERIRTRIDGARRIVVLGCTGGAGQTVTALMLGHTFAAHRDDRIIAVDVNPGPTGLAGRTRSETRETLTSLLTHAERLTGYPAMRRHTSATRSGLEIVAAGKNPVQALDDRDYALATRTLDRFYAVSLLDAAAAVVARVLPYTDQIVLVAPASEDAPRAVGMTFEWLDGHGYDELRARAVTVINGVSRSTLADVEQAEMVAKGRCRALVRIPWDAHLDPRRPPCNELRALRAPTRKAYLALAGVVAGGFAQVPERHRQREVTR